MKDLKELIMEIDWTAFDPNLELDPEVEQFLRVNVEAHREYLLQFLAFCMQQQRDQAREQHDTLAALLRRCAGYPGIMHTGELSAEIQAALAVSPRGAV